jgi:polysaccharide export outer membrane protein
VSAKRDFEIFHRINTTGSGLKPCLRQPIAGLTLLTFLAVAIPEPARSQLPASKSGNASQVNSLPAKPVPQLAQGVTSGLCDRPLGVRLPPNTPYTLGAGDRVKMDVFDVPEYSGEYIVLVDGTLNLPIIGTVPVRELTIPAASAEISRRYSTYLKRPLVTLSLLAAHPVTLAVAGEVNRPGTYTVTPGTGGGQGAGGQTSQFPTVTQAITLAGGITQSAAVRQVIITRRGYDPNTPFVVDLFDLIQTGNLAQDVTLRDGDTIYIPPVNAVSPAETRLLTDASFASRDPRPINVTLVGEVSRPGPYSITGGGEATGGATGAVTGTTTGATGAGGGGGATTGPPTVTKAIQIAGGITALADVRSITIRRSTRSCGDRLINVNMWNLLREGDIAQDVILQEGDSITIPTATALDPAEATQLAGASFAPNTIVVNVVGEVTKPGAIPVPPNTPLNQAVLAAGGFNTRARKRSVDLIRLNPNGTVEKREIDVDLAQGINTEGNPTLRNNDVVVVRRSTLASIGDTLGTILTPVGNFVNFLRIFGF